MAKKSIPMDEAIKVWEKPLEKVFPTRSHKDDIITIHQFMIREGIMYARIELQNLQYLFLYSQEQTVNMIQRRHLKMLEQTLLQRYLRTYTRRH